MAEGDEKDRGFKVQDRRRFSAEGEAKPDTREEESKAAPPPPRNDDTIEQPSAGAQAQASAAYRQASSEAGPEDITFVSFIVGLSTEALALMGEMPHPATGEQINDLRGAQQLIDILGLLREKTRGNLNRDEESLIDAILFDLRMKYVEKARPVR
jgi:hypothetical protein